MKYVSDTTHLDKEQSCTKGEYTDLLGVIQSSWRYNSDYETIDEITDKPRKPRKPMHSYLLNFWYKVNLSSFSFFLLFIESKKKKKKIDAESCIFSISVGKILGASLNGSLLGYGFGATVGREESLARPTKFYGSLED